MDIELSNYVELLSKPSRLWSREEVLSNPNLVADSGAYTYYFKQIPQNVPTTSCIQHDGLTLLYVGASPSGESSDATLQNRLKTHYDGRARFSTLRLSLGSLLMDQLDLEFRCTNGVKKKKITLTDNSEATLSNWMSENAFVTWVEIAEPWRFEVGLIKSLKPPLNIKHNKEHPSFTKFLRERRRKARERAKI